MSDEPANSADGLLEADLGEIHTRCQAAALGAGFSTAMATHAGETARALAAWAQPGPEAVLAVLRAMDGHADDFSPASHSTPDTVSDAAPDTTPDTTPEPSSDPTEDTAVVSSGEKTLWQAQSGLLCPLSAGAMLQAQAGTLSRAEPIILENVLSPLLLVPFLTRAAVELSCMVHLRGEIINMAITPAGPLKIDWASCRSTGIDSVQIDWTLDLPLAATPDCCGINTSAHAQQGDAPWPVSTETWNALGQFAQRLSDDHPAESANE